MIFDAIKAAVLRAEGATIQEAFSSSDQVAVEMADLANEVASDIASSHDWRALTKIHSLAGGSETYPLPADYDRMVLASEIDDSASWLWGYQPFDSVNDWMRYKSGTYPILSPGGWIILGGEMHFYPAARDQAQFPYISNRWARSEAGTPKASFTADDDEFVLSERLMTLGLIWRWKAQKGLEYAEDMATYELALAQAQTRDRGAHVLRSNRPINYRGAGLAYTGRAFP